jgi:hypothetical protein
VGECADVGRSGGVTEGCVRGIIPFLPRSQFSGLVEYLAGRFLLWWGDGWVRGNWVGVVGLG